uniref:GK21534 n=1 Tax=Drosophila willistoni TaxID=7260 RepID=B4MPV6_DROWI
MATKVLFPTFYNEENKIWSGAERIKLYNDNCSVGQIIFNNLKNWPDNIIQITHMDDTVVTNAEFLTWSTRIALFLKTEGLTHMDVVGIIANSSTYLVPLTVACFFNTTPFHAITKEWSPKIVSLTGHVDGVLSIDDLLKPNPAEKNYRPLKLAVGPDQTAALLCSSGTSSLPKAVTLSNSFLAATSALSTSTDILYTSATLDWLTCLSTIIMSLFSGMTRIVSNEPFNASHLIEIIKKYKITFIVLAPWQAYELFNNPQATLTNLQTLKISFITGGWISWALLQKARKILPSCAIMFGYGTTETGLVTINMDHQLKASVGKIAPGIRVKILDDQGKHLPHNEVGEILIDIGLEWKGYVDNPKDTASTLQNGWINLGDLGYFDNDNNLYVVDRKKDLLKYKSSHYWPNELEQIIAELPEVQQVCVVGVRDERGDAAGALVITKEGTTISEQKIIDHVAQRVGADYKHLNAGVQFFSEFPMNANGKLKEKQ